MAVTHGTTANSGKVFSNARVFNYVRPVGAFPFLKVSIEMNDVVTINAGPAYGGVPLILIATQYNAAGNDHRTYLYYLVDPLPLGANDLTYGLTGNAMHACTISTYFNVDPVFPLGTSAKATGTDATPTVNVVSEAGDMVVDAVGFTSGAARNIAVGAGQTNRTSTNSGAGVDIGYGASEEDGAAAVTMSWAIAGGNPDCWCIIAVPLRPHVPFSSRLIEYTFNVWDPLQRLIGRDGHAVNPNEVRADKWGKLLGFRSPSSKTYASIADGPDHFYISGVTSDGETVRITPDEKQFADMILKRLTR